uniref:Glyco_hydro_18 domain-containing protein n=1 Tax=Caenorhabditis tropicalis TaxID=1561998 RepID=A0A1I7UCG3_9PELO
MRYLTCQTKKPSKLNMGLQFNIIQWGNVREATDPSDEMWRRAEIVNGTFDKAVYLWRHADQLFDANTVSWHEPTKSSYHWDPEKRVFSAFENEKSVMEKMKYAKKYNFGGIFMFSASSDDDDQGTLMNVVSSFPLCTDESKDQVNYDC